MKRIVYFVIFCLMLFPLASCSPSPAVSRTLRIVTDLGIMDGSSSCQETGLMDLEAIVQFYGGLPNNLELELEVLPQEAEDLHSRLTSLRTEIMSGKGPDLFILSTDWGDCFANQERLFPNPEKAAAGDFFLPVDHYLANAKHMDFNALIPQIMEVGKTEKGQTLLPMFFTVNTGATESLPASVSWDEAISGTNQIAAAAYAGGLRENNFRSMVLGEIANHQKEELLITQEELLARIKEALSLSVPEEEDAPGIWDTFLKLDFDSASEHTAYFPLRNCQQGLTARVNAFLAINKNSSHPDDAFALADMLMSREFLTLEGFWSETRTINQSQTNLWYTLSLMCAYPVHQSLLDNEATIRYALYIPQETLSVYHQILEQIDFVYIPANIDTLLEELYAECLAAKDEAAVEKLVKEAYTTMKMMLAES